METLNSVTKKLQTSVLGIKPSTIMAITLAIGSDMVITRLPVVMQVKMLLKVVALTTILFYYQNMPLQQAFLIATVYIAIVMLLTRLKTANIVPITAETENTEWVSTGPSHSVTLRGHTYTHDDPVRVGPVEQPVVGPTGYMGPETATY